MTDGRRLLVVREIRQQVERVIVIRPMMLTAERDDVERVDDEQVRRDAEVHTIDRRAIMLAADGVSSFDAVARAADSADALAVDLRASMVPVAPQSTATP